MHANYLSKFIEAYIDCGYWADSGESELHISPEDVADIKIECADFVEAAGDLLADITPEQAGHDFYLTRCQHGAGFWDRGLGDVGRSLTELAHAYGHDDRFFMLREDFR